MKRTISIALLVAMLTSVACGETAPTVETTSAAGTTSAEVTTEDLLADNIETVDYGGKEFNILSRGNFTYEFDTEQTGDILDDAIYNRNRTVEERFNIKINTIVHGAADGTSAGNMANVLEPANNAIMAGDDAYQLLSAYLHKAATDAYNGYYANWLEMPHINFDKVWWEKDFIDEIALDGKAYVALGDLSLLFNEVKLAIFFNKQLAEDYKLPNLYELVNDGKWTIDRLGELASLAVTDLNGDGEYDVKDRYGIGVNGYTHTIPFIYSCNTTTMIRNDSDGKYKVNDTQRLFDVFERVYKLLVESGAGYVCKDGKMPFEEGMFENNQGLFMTAWIGYARDLRDMDTDFGIIPYPKWDEAQEDYYTSYLDRTSSFLIPITADLDYVCRITEVLAAESYKQVIPAFYEKALKTKFARDNESEEMLDIITRNTTYDFGLIFAGLKSAPVMTYRQAIMDKNDAFASKLAETKEAYIAAIDAMLEKVK